MLWQLLQIVRIGMVVKREHLIGMMEEYNIYMVLLDILRVFILMK
jgi:hypothetical protein